MGQPNPTYNLIDPTQLARFAMSISTHFFIHTYCYICFQTTKHMFLSACTKHPLKYSKMMVKDIHHNKTIMIITNSRTIHGCNGREV